MKRIVLGLSIFLLLSQSLIAMTDEEYDIKISEQTTEVWKQIWRCNKASRNHKHTADVDICLKAVELLKNDNWEEKDYRILYLNIGATYNYQDDKLNAYKYYIKAAKLGEIDAQKNLKILCKEDPWACK